MFVEESVSSQYPVGINGDALDPPSYKYNVSPLEIEGFDF
jgi:hypothetical protein